MDYKTCGLNRKLKLVPSAVSVIEDRLFFCDRYSDGLYSFNLSDFKVECHGKLCDGVGRFVNLYQTIVRYENYLVFVPYNSCEICSYNLRTGVVKNKRLPGSFLPNRDNFFCGVAVSDGVVMFGYNNDSVLKYSIENDSIEYCLCKCNDLKSDTNTNNDRGLLIHQAVCSAGYIYAVSLKECSIIRLSQDMKQMDRIELKARVKGFSGICVSDEKLFLTPYSGGIFVEYDLKNGVERIIDSGMTFGDWSFAGSVIIKGSAYSVPVYGWNVLKTNLETYECVQLNRSAGFDVCFDENLNCSVPVSHDDVVIASMFNTGELFCYYTDERCLKIKSLETGEIPAVSFKAGLQIESNFCTLDMMLKSL